MPDKTSPAAQEAAFARWVARFDAPAPDARAFFAQALDRLEPWQLARWLGDPAQAGRREALAETTRQLLDAARAGAALPGRLAFNLLTLGSALLPRSLHDDWVRQLRHTSPGRHAGSIIGAGAGAASGPGLHATDADDAAAAASLIAEALRLDEDLDDDPAPPPPRAAAPGGRLRIALLLTGELGDHAAAWQRWQALGLSAHALDVQVHAERAAPSRQPAALRQRCGDPAFADALQTLAARTGLPSLARRYPRLGAALGLDGTPDDAALRALYGDGAQLAVEDGDAAGAAGRKGLRRLRRQVRTAQAALVGGGRGHDLVIHARVGAVLPAPSVLAPAPDWAQLAARSRAGRTVFCDAGPSLREDLVIGERFAAGSPEAMAAYAEAWALVPTACAEGWHGFPREEQAPSALAYACLYQGLRVEALPGLAAAPAEADPATRGLDRETLGRLLRQDLPAGPASDEDHRLWQALALPPGPASAP